MKLRKRIRLSLERFRKDLLFSFKEFSHYAYAYKVFKTLEKKKNYFHNTTGIGFEAFIPREKLPNRLFDKISESGWIATKIRRYGYRFFRCHKFPSIYRISYYTNK